jgi:hypothetical protein
MYVCIYSLLLAKELAVAQPPLNSSGFGTVCQQFLFTTGKPLKPLPIILQLAVLLFP